MVLVCEAVNSVLSPPSPSEEQALNAPNTAIQAIGSLNYDTLTGVNHDGDPDPLTGGGNSNPNRVDPVNLYDDLDITLPIGLSSPQDINDPDFDNPYIGTSCLQTKEEEKESTAELIYIFSGGNTNSGI
jgi:hypothetical protein